MSLARCRLAIAWPAAESVDRKVIMKLLPIFVSVMLAIAYPVAGMALVWLIAYVVFAIVYNAQFLVALPLFFPIIIPVIGLFWIVPRWRKTRDT